MESQKKKIKVLLVDDDETIRGIYGDVFRQSGFEVEEAVDGVGGLDKATKGIPDLIFTGIIMPRMDGFALIDALKKNVTTANIPIIMNSHMGREEDRKKSQEMGVQEFIVQGMVTPRQVVEKIRLMFGSGEYLLKFNPTDLDAPRLQKDLHFPNNFICPNCQIAMIMSAKIMNSEKKEFSVRLVCPNCENKSQKA